MATNTLRTGLAYGLVTTFLVVLLVLSGQLSPVGRFLGATVGLLVIVKIGGWLLISARSTEYSLSTIERVLFVTVWPGVRPDLFAGSERYETPSSRTFVVGYAYLFVGVGLALASLLVVPHIGIGPSTWLLLFAFLAVVHSGFGRLLPFFLRWLGYAVPPLFSDPLKSESVGEFWSERWNRPFINMNRLFLTDPLSSRVGMGIAAMIAFLVSGIAHELAISYPAGEGWGLPFAYFLLQGLFYSAEQRFFSKSENGSVILRRAWTLLAVLGPLPLLFHAPFRLTFLAPLIEGGRAVLLSYSIESYLSVGLWIGAAGHFLVLAASYQVPEELDWDTDLQTLKPLNRKLLWTYGGYIVLTIVFFGIMTATFHDEFVQGSSVALGVSAMIVVFWTIRVLIDCFYFSHDDWPEGIEYTVGHSMLTSLFVLLILIYSATILTNVL